MINDLYFILARPLISKTIVETIQEICIKTEPKPFFCESPDDLKLRFSNEGTILTYTTTSSSASGSAMRITTTTTL